MEPQVVILINGNTRYERCTKSWTISVFVHLSFRIVSDSPQIEVVNLKTLDLEPCQ